MQDFPDRDSSVSATRILIIDDDRETCRTLSTLLKSEGMECENTCDGATGLEMARHLRPDLILCDVNMPGMDGYSVLRALHNNPITSVIPFIFLSGEQEHDSIRRGMGLGADDFVTKPFLTQQLLASIHARIDRQKVITRRLENLRVSLAQSVPHEFFTPLNTILGFSILNLESLRSGNEINREDLSDTFSEIHSAGEHLLRVASNYVMFTQLSIEDRESAPPCVELPHEKWEPELAKTIRRAATGHGRMTDLRFSFLPATLAITSEHLNKLICELLDNAVKFSRGGDTISITGALRESGYVFQVQDRGCGMERSQIENVEPMVQFERQKQVQAGVGLGLSICRLIANRYRGILEIVPNPEKGITVTVTLPVPREETKLAV